MYHDYVLLATRGGGGGGGLLKFFCAFIPILCCQNKMAANYKLLSKFSVVPVDKFEGECPYFRQPKQVGCFSLDEEREFLDNDSGLRHYSPPEVVNFDLRLGYKEFIRREEEKKDRLDDMLRWIEKHPENFALSGDKSQNDGRLVCDEYVRNNDL